MDVICDLSANLTFADSRCFFARPAFLKERLLPRRDEVDDHAGRYMEHLLAACLHATMAQWGTWAPLAVSPDLVGVSGTTGRSIERSPIRRAADGARRRIMLRLLAHT